MLPAMQSITRRRRRIAEVVGVTVNTAADTVLSTSSRTTSSRLDQSRQIVHFEQTNTDLLRRTYSIGPNLLPQAVRV